MRTWAEINLDAIKYNFDQVKSKTNSKIMAIIKADAYGHGVKEVAELLQKEGAYAFGVATSEEALELRSLGFTLPILILGVIFEEEYHKIIENNISFAIADIESARIASDVAKTLGKKALVHIKLDTGMGRIGFRFGEESTKEIVEISKMENVEIQGIFSHMAKADEEDKTYANMQFKAFTDMCARLEEKGVCLPLKHIANSASIATLPHTHLDMVRSGIVTYGLNPSDEVNEKHISLKPAMTLKSRISHVKIMEEDSAISYGGHYIAKKGQKIATVAIGYADGFSRVLSGRTKVLVNGELAPVVGNICMDQCMIDATNIKDIKIGDEVIIFGSDGNNTISVDSVALLIGTINYEIVCSVTKRVPRVYIQNNKIIARKDY